MESFLKTMLFIFYFCVLLFFTILDIRWDQKVPVQISVVEKSEDRGKRSVLVSTMDLKKMVFRELEVSWENLRKKNIFYEGK
ncbi:hypothetical protein J9305_07140 [Leptospira interrogans]|uniref:Uncharacterized protein n=1 Tax=Leptospira interrogans serovar Zanoni str. LT2156 TaxID=1001601 RepID=M6HUH5_LEPIR|nr:hypothetical protein [Leptospira interrogans]EJP01446.1 hypothetical protein LEP1GSC007_1634 [Leptospira interrogans serovar Bulgarica str. Mallika]EMM94531.1 hypothetical protein LEP1GSC158_2176 [Leptospira interrogans serovar Zanoni str. LT2156]MCR8639287.1 hypothetical protein [Leptospira interrogans serovar Ricardi]UID84737.1 hypothetical protein J9305_07140 [Leptospira interrogans]